MFAKKSHEQHEAVDVYTFVKGRESWKNNIIRSQVNTEDNLNLLFDKLHLLQLP